MNLKEVGKELELKRRKMDLTQSDLAEMTGISQTTISAIERGHRNVQVKTLVKLLDALDIGSDFSVQKERVGPQERIKEAMRELGLSEGATDVVLSLIQSLIIKEQGLAGQEGQIV